MKYSKTFAEALEDVRKPKVVKEEDDHEVSMAVGQVRVMKERLDTIMSFLSSKTDDYNIEGFDFLNIAKSFASRSPSLSLSNFF